MQRPAQRPEPALKPSLQPVLALFGIEHGLDDIDASKQSIDYILVHLYSIGPDGVQKVFHHVRKASQLCHLHGSGPTLEGVRSPEYLVYGIMVGGIILEHEDILLQSVHLGSCLGEEIFEEFLIVRVQIIAHYGM